MCEQSACQSGESGRCRVDEPTRASHARRMLRDATAVLVSALVLGLAAATTASAQPSAAPSLLSLALLPPSATSLRVEASINPEGLDTTYLVRYGATAAYGASTPAEDAGSGTVPVTVTVVVTGLSPGTTYHLLFEATNSVGTTSGPDLTAATAPSTPSTAQSAPALPQPPIRQVAHPTATSRGFTRLPVASAAGTELNSLACATRSLCFAVGVADVTSTHFHP